MRQQAAHWWCMLWCMKRTNIYLAEGQAAALDRFGVLAEQEAFSRSRDQRSDYLDRLADA